MAFHKDILRLDCTAACEELVANLQRDVRQTLRRSAARSSTTSP